MDTVKKYSKLILIAAVIAAASFGVGRYATPAKTVTNTVQVKVRDEEYTKQRVADAKKQWTKDLHKTTVTTAKVIKPCPPTGGGTQVIESTTTTTTDLHSAGTSDTHVASNEHGTAHETDTTHTTITPVDSGKSSTWSLSLIASGTFFNGKDLTFAPTYGASVGYRLLGPVNLSVAAYTNKQIVGSLGLELGKNWEVGIDAGTSFTKLHPFFGGTVSRRLVGPVWISAWGTSETAVGLAASFKVR